MSAAQDNSSLLLNWQQGTAGRSTGFDLQGVCDRPVTLSLTGVTGVPPITGPNLKSLPSGSITGLATEVGERTDFQFAERVFKLH
jgi:hypothetical protein